ncbi:hypothetical protein NPIL_672801 [Nephila pilipes]|uniref:Venom protein n=1 Tax=Nephila pilipes TaxID=299642 RepID=A0A8X6N8D6_NEPPI|nr:hypothetical protein NPIL_672801 [Nephila pilipes]
MMKIVIFLLLAIVVREAIACSDIICDGNLSCENVNCGSIECKPVSCGPHQIHKKNGGICGCCDECVRALQKGDDCVLTYLHGSPPPVECQKGLTCNPQTRKCD